MAFVSDAISAVGGSALALGAGYLFLVSGVTGRLFIAAIAAVAMLSFLTYALKRDHLSRLMTVVVVVVMLVVVALWILVSWLIAR